LTEGTEKEYGTVVVLDEENDMMIVEVGLGDVMLLTEVVLVLGEDEDALVSGGELWNNWLK
jgi:hypothetical protein